MERKQHFVLIHGSCHGAWCWYKVVNLLKTAGHQVTALDLGASGVDPKRLEEVTSFSDYLQPLMDFFASLPDEQDRKVILVGHSYAGLCISLAMERFPKKISVAVFIAAYMPHHSSPPGTLIQEDLELGKMLVRPSGLFVEDLVSGNLLTEEKFGSVDRVFIKLEGDKVMMEEFQQLMIQNSPKDVKVISEAGHMVMLSKPHELYRLLQDIGDNFS
ncbi:hypothetical protein Goshw_003211 [Gossypium schwendimanii]|uniref:AB hydrolase-1 domain-containing protein n=2 Tax=Gossypium TaxID=3633 RepID=A0A7J9ECA1_9ROSI|nr:hypothetical protein [Gossypium trilobum]MBA0859092.1 hypothetical protein [Gossypium schwendimanii]